MPQKPATPITLQCQDGVCLPAEHFPANTPSRATLILAPALAVPQRFYAQFASGWSKKGFNVLTFDYRGCGAAKKAVPASEAHPLAWGSQDIDAAIRWGLDQATPVVFLGHSMGGQLLGLAPSASQLSAVIFMGATEPHASYYPPKSRLWFNLVWRGLIPAATLGREQCPLSGLKAPSVAIRQWAKWCTTKGYLFHGLSAEQLAGYHDLECPLLSIALTDDSYAPATAITPLLQHYRSTEQETVTYSPSDAGVSAVGHFGYFRQNTGQQLWLHTQDWINTNIQAR